MSHLTCTYNSCNKQCLKWIPGGVSMRIWIPYCNLLFQFVRHLFRTLPSPPFQSFFACLNPRRWWCINRILKTSSSKKKEQHSRCMEIPQNWRESRPDLCNLCFSFHEVACWPVVDTGLNLSAQTVPTNSVAKTASFSYVVFNTHV